MIFVHIKADYCPVCSSLAIKDECDQRTHCNGGKWEIRTFGCGLVLKYIPNFRKIETSGECTNSKEYKAKKETKEREIKTLRKWIDENVSDKDLRSTVQRRVEYIPL